MGLRSVEQFRQSLRDNRNVRFEGKRVPDVTEHPVLRVGVETAAIDYEMTEDPAVSHLAVVEADGEAYSRYFHLPKTPEDLYLRHQLIEEASRRACGFPPFAKEGGSDALLAVEMISHHLARETKQDYPDRVRAFRRHCQQGDLSLAVAMTDVKGDRSKRPSKQSDPDAYVHIKDRDAKGIVVRGAKVHITTAPYTNEILVLPTRAMKADDAAYAVSFAVPVSTPGLTVVARASGPARFRPEEYPISSRLDIIEGLVIFDDVFVPWERVFLCGEWAYAGPLTNAFATYHRFTAASYKYPFLRLMAGAARLMAACNGTHDQSHIREKTTWLAMYAETAKALALGAARECRHDELSGLYYPDPISGNLAKFYFADNYHQAVKLIQDICGGVLVTMPSVQDLEDPEMGHELKRYLTGASAYSAEQRLRLLRLVRDMAVSDLGGFWEVTSLHGEGSLAAEKLALAGMVPWSRYENEALEAAGLPRRA